MKFKNSSDEKTWNSKRSLVSPDNEKHTWRLIQVVEAIDRILQAAGHDELVITSFYREPTAKPSYHPAYQAVDFRAHGKSEKWWNNMKYLKFALRQWHSDIQLVLHEELRGEPNEHIHLEIDSNNPVSIVNPA